MRPSSVTLDFLVFINIVYNIESLIIQTLYKARIFMRFMSVLFINGQQDLDKFTKHQHFHYSK